MSKWVSEWVNEWVRKRERERESVCVCVCVRVRRARSLARSLARSRERERESVGRSGRRQNKKVKTRTNRMRNSLLPPDVCQFRPKLHGYTGCKRTCSVEQAVSCIWPVHEANRAPLSTGGSLELGSLHTRSALFWESTSHQPRVLIGYWVNQLASVKWRGGEMFRLVQRTTD